MDETKAVPHDHPHRREFQRWEKEATAQITAALDAYRRDLFRGITRDTVRDVLARLQDNDTRERLRQALYNALLPVAVGGVDAQRGKLERMMGVKRDITTPGFDWEMVHEIARAWLRTRTYNLIYANEYSITETTRRGLTAAIDAFITDGSRTMRDLIADVEGLFDPIRGEMIAVTEVTRTFAEGELTAMRESGITQGKMWQTANDELVCPICGPLNQKVVALDATFPGGFDSPPAHPRCRCWVSPVTRLEDG